MDRYDWIIGICSTRSNGVKIFRFRGSIEEMKQKILSLILEDKTADDEDWIYGCEEIDEIKAQDNGLGYELYGYGSYRDYEIHYTAKEFAHIDFLTND